METIRELKEKTQKQKRGKTFLLAFGYEWHRNFSIYITWILLKFFPNIRPNQVSLLMLLTGLLGALFILSPDFSKVIFGFALIYLSFLLDKVDGEIARYKGIFSISGVYLDELYHALVTGALYIAVFLPFLLSDSSTLRFLVVFVVWLSILNRYNRKSAHTVYVKMRKYIRDGSLEKGDTSRVVTAFWNFFPFKLSSIPERFDVILLTLFITLLYDKMTDAHTLLYYLYTLSILLFIQFIRGIFLLYFGGVEHEAKRLEEGEY